MNGNKRYLLDTNAIIALLRGERSLIGLLDSPEWMGISIISYLEFLSFPQLTKQDQELFDNFCKRIEIVSLNYHQADLLHSAIQFRKQSNLKLPDAIIASSAICNHAVLVTADRDFFKLQDLQVFLFS